MSRFTEAEVELYDDGILLVTPLAYELLFLGSGLIVWAPAGFWSDGISLRGPAWFKRLLLQIMPVEKMKRPAVVHDLTRKDRRWRKLQSDYAFWEAMGVEGVPAFWRTVATLAVLLNFSRH
jgi:hypothetical protein